MAVIFTLEEVAPNRSRLLVVTVGLLVALAAIIQAIGSDNSPDPVDPATVSSSSSEGTSTAKSDSASTSTLSTTAPSTIITPTTSFLPPTSSVPYPVSFTAIGEGAITISGYGNNVIDAGDEWPNYRTAIYRTEDPDSGLIIELRDNQIVVASFGYSDSGWPVQGIRWLDDITQGVQEIVVTASAGWEIDLLPDSFLWNQQIDTGNTPQLEDLLLFSSQGLTFVGSPQTRSAEGVGDLMIYNACEGPCNEEPTTWVFQLSPDCSGNTPDFFIKEVGTPFFEQISETDPRFGQQSQETMFVTLDTYDWLQVLTPCEWVVQPNSG